jgi:hypothetical protein
MLLHTSGERMEITIAWPVVPDRGRPLDKAVASAATTSLSYLLRDLLLMPRVDEADDIAGRDDTHVPAPAKARRGKEPAALSTISQDDMQELAELMTTHKIAWSMFAQHFRVSRLSELPASRLDEARAFASGVKGQLEASVAAAVNGKGDGLPF